MLEGGESFLEIGLGNGANLQNAAEKFRLVVGTDMLRIGSLVAQRSSGIEIIRADKASCFQKAAFDVVAFNPPYLPAASIQDQAIDGGPHGVEVPLEFLESAIAVTRPEGEVLVLLSSLSKFEMFAKYCTEHSLLVRQIAEKKLFFETLSVYVVKRNLRSSYEKSA
jgi:release factor glutamine methyltransferase